MYSRPTAPKTIGGVLDDIFKLFFAAWLKCWGLALIAGVLVAIPSIYMLVVGGASREELLQVMSSPIYWCIYLLAIVPYLAFHTAMLIRATQVANGEDGGFASAVLSGLRLVPRSFLALILLFWPVVLLGIVAAIFVPAARSNPALVGFAALVVLVLLIPYLVWVVYRSLYNVFIVVEDKSARESLSASRQLVAGNWWRTVAIVTVATFIVIVFAVCVQFVGSLVMTFGGASVELVALGAQVVTLAMNIVLYPFLATTVLGIYFDLKLRKEGDDLSDRVAALDKA